MGAAESIFYDEEPPPASSIEAQRPYPTGQHGRNSAARGSQVARRPKQKGRLLPVKTLQGLVLGLPGVGKRTLLERLKGKDPFDDTLVGERQDSSEQDLSQAIIPYQAPAGSKMLDRVQIKVEASPEVVNADFRVDFAVVLINPRDDSRQVQMHIAKVISDLLKAHEIAREQQQQSNDLDTATLALRMCFLINFRDIHNSKKKGGIQEGEVQQFVLAILQQCAQQIQNPEQVLLQFGTISLYNCYGLSTLHHFLFDTYLRVKRKEIELQLSLIDEQLTKSHEVPRMKYKDFLKIANQTDSTDRVHHRGHKTKVPDHRGGVREENGHHAVPLHSASSHAATSGDQDGTSQEIVVDGHRPQNDAAQGRRRLVPNVQELAPASEPISPPTPENAEDSLEAFLASDDEEEEPIQSAKLAETTTSLSRRGTTTAADMDDDDDDDFFYNEKGERCSLRNHDKGNSLRMKSKQESTDSNVLTQANSSSIVEDNKIEGQPRSNDDQGEFAVREDSGENGKAVEVDDSGQGVSQVEGDRETVRITEPPAAAEETIPKPLSHDTGRSPQTTSQPSSDTIEGKLPDQNMESHSDAASPQDQEVGDSEANEMAEQSVTHALVGSGETNLDQIAATERSGEHHVDHDASGGTRVDDVDTEERPPQSSAHRVGQDASDNDIGSEMILENTPKQSAIITTDPDAPEGVREDVIEHNTKPPSRPSPQTRSTGDNQDPARTGEEHPADNQDDRALSGSSPESSQQQPNGAHSDHESGDEETSPKPPPGPGQPDKETESAAQGKNIDKTECKDAASPCATEATEQRVVESGERAKATDKADSENMSSSPRSTEAPEGGTTVHKRDDDDDFCVDETELEQKEASGISLDPTRTDHRIASNHGEDSDDEDDFFIDENAGDQGYRYTNSATADPQGTGENSGPKQTGNVSDDEDEFFIGGDNENPNSDGKKSAGYQEAVAKAGASSEPVDKKSEVGERHPSVMPVSEESNSELETARDGHGGEKPLTASKSEDVSEHQTEASVQRSENTALSAAAHAAIVAAQKEAELMLMQSRNVVASKPSKSKKEKKKKKESKKQAKAEKKEKKKEKKSKRVAET